MTIKRFIGKSWPIKGDGAEFVLQFAEHNITAQFAVHSFAQCTLLQSVAVNCIISQTMSSYGDDCCADVEDEEKHVDDNYDKKYVDDNDDDDNNITAEVNLWGDD